MIKKFYKVMAICCIWIMMFGNIKVVNAKATLLEDRMFNFKTTEWEQLIETVKKIKSENSEKPANEVVEIISRVINSRNNNNRGITDIWNVLTNSEKKLVVRYPLAALKVNDAKNIATSQTELKFGYNGLGDRSDAFRHGIWNAEMTIMIGAEKAELFATAHEDKDTSGLESDGHTKEEHKNMDLNNNSVGRRIGLENSNFTEGQMADYIYEAIHQENTEFIWLND